MQANAIERANDDSWRSCDQNHLGNDQEYVATYSWLQRMKQSEDLKCNYYSTINLIAFLYSSFLSYCNCLKLHPIDSKHCDISGAFTLLK